MLKNTERYTLLIMSTKTLSSREVYRNPWPSQMMLEALGTMLVDGSGFIGRVAAVFEVKKNNPCLTVRCSENVKQLDESRLAKRKKP